MLTVLKYLVIFFLSCSEAAKIFPEKTNDTEVVLVNNTLKGLNRRGKLVDAWISFLIGAGGLVKLTNLPCTATNNLEGICYTNRQCKRLDGGISSGLCARNKGVCCAVLKTCGASVNHNNTYFQNPGFPGTYAGGSRCSLTINKCDSTICQVRIEFIRLSLAQPVGGVCSSDALTITGSAGPILRICGDNDGQHVYMDFNGPASMQMTIDAPASVSFSRSWQIKIMQIPCDSVTKAPTGCLQYYYTGTTGLVRSFNFGTSLLDPISSSRQIRNLNYGMCFLMQPGFCQITYTAQAANTFVVSETGGVVGLPQNGATCTDNYVAIPAPTGLAVEKFCGSAFPASVVTAIKPFVLYSVSSTLVGGGTYGYSIRWTQNRCNNNLIL